MAVPSPSPTVTSLIEMSGGLSLSWIVPVPVATAMFALVALDRLTVKVSSGSSSASSMMVTSTLLLLSPAVKVSVPESAV